MALLAALCRTNRKEESGYVLATTALLLIPLMIFAAFAVDVGAWYAEADEAQRAADAAALGGVVWMPDLSRATTAVRDIALENGYDHNDPDVNVIVERRGTQGIHVKIETKGETHFGRVVMDEIDITRHATANYILPVPLGNPGSALGSGLDSSPVAGAPRENLLLALNGYCQGYQNGDPFGTRWFGGSGCGSTQNTRYSDQGYDFIIDFTGPDGANSPVTGQWDLQIFEPGSCGQNSESGSSARIETTMWRGDDTLFTDDDNKVPGNLVLGENGSALPRLWDSAACGDATSQWVKAYEIDADSNQGRWILRTRTLAVDAETSLNSFGLRVVPRNTNTPCGSILPSSSCPQLYARTWLPIFIPSTITDVAGTAQTTFGGSPSALFYLANVPEIHKSKVLEIKLFDPGEGMANMQVLAPDNTRYPFQRSVLPENGVQSGFVDNNNTCTVTDPALTDTVTALNVAYECLDVTGSIYNGDEVTIRVQIPNNYSCVPDDPLTVPVEGPNCWWRVRYQPQNTTSGVTDRTTWSIRVLGDPIRLTE
ncbi:MAG: pilus assembly protein TadG-related protein [Acidimicrobiales bacterium]